MVVGGAYAGGIGERMECRCRVLRRCGSGMADEGVGANASGSDMAGAGVSVGDRM